MDAPPPQSSAAAAAARSGSSAAYTAEIAESLRFEEEIQSLMRDNTLIHPSLDPAPPPPPPPSSSSAASSFTALLGLSPNQAVELLHDSIGGASASAAAAASSAAAADPWPRLGLPLPRASPTFPSNAALVDRAARFSVFAAAAAAAAAAASDSSSPASSSGDPSPAAPPPPPRRPSPAPKRKDPPSSSVADKSKAKAKTKRSSGGGGGGGGVRSAEEGTGGFEKLPYVHVRARRGQATDSHSLAERARREKINARMKLLQELVPGCSKISGTALVLDEIINHVQSLQRQVEFLSMRLAAVNPRVDFGGLDSFLSAECGRIAEDNGNGNGKNGAEEEGQRAAWTDGGSDGVRRPQHHHHHHHHQQQQIWHVDLAHPHHAPSAWERGPGDAHPPHLFINPSSGGVASLYAYDPSSASAPLQSNQLKTEL